MTTPTKRLIVAITGATGAAYGVRLLQRLRTTDGWHSALVLTPAGVLNAQTELGMTRPQIEAFAHEVHNPRDIGASIASGSFPAQGMVIAPCSMKTLAAIAHGYSDNLVTRAADVTLKERRRLVLLPRETPLNLIHLRNMVSVTEAGGIIFPPLPAFYFKPNTIDELIEHTVDRVLALFDIPVPNAQHWQGIKHGATDAPSD